MSGHLIAGRYPHGYYELFDALVTEALRGGDGLLLDAGCGSGRVWPRLQRPLVGIEYKRVGLSWRLAVPVAVADIRALPFHDSSYGTVLCAEVIEHVREDGLLLRELRRVLRPGGRLVLTTSPLLGTPMALLIPLKNLLHPHHAKEHINLQHPARLLGAVTAAGFAIDEVRYWNVLSLTHYLSLFGYERAAAWWHARTSCLQQPFLNNNIIITATAA